MGDRISTAPRPDRGRWASSRGRRHHEHPIMSAIEIRDTQHPRRPEPRVLPNGAREARDRDLARAT